LVVVLCVERNVRRSRNVCDVVGLDVRGYDLAGV